MPVPFYFGGEMAKKDEFNIDNFFEDFKKQERIEAILDDFNYQIKSQFAKDYNDIRREIARLLIVEFNTPSGKKKDK